MVQFHGTMAVGFRSKMLNITLKCSTGLICFVEK